MCGIVGFAGIKIGSVGDPLHLLQRMGKRIASRGPDSHGEWFDVGSSVGFAHRRLAIVDLTDSGSQPMTSPCGRYVLIFNGEIYNHLELRSELSESGIGWRGSSDTETLIRGIQRWGVRAAVQRCVGMFAFALWDRTSERLTLARDRFGEKPLYFARGRSVPGGGLLFASDLNPFREYAGFRAEIDPQSAALFRQYGYIPGPRSIFRDCFKVEAGSLVHYLGRGGVIESETYWSADEAINCSVNNKTSADFFAAVEELDSILARAIRSQMIADVPLGAFLSGGIDSSVVVALMQKHSTVPIKTFSVGFKEARFDESRYAAAVAKHLGTDHTEVVLSSRDAREIVPTLGAVYSEPFADSSQVATIMVSRVARERVTVALSGDGGDEVFGGYNRYILAESLWRKIELVPHPIRRRIARSIRTGRAARYEQLISLVSRIGPSAYRFSDSSRVLQRLATALSCEGLAEVYESLVSTGYVGKDQQVSHRVADSYMSFAKVLPDGVDRMMASDTVTYLPDDILVKVDRAAMSVSLETRAPFLDHRVFEFAWRLPTSLKISNGVTKRCLRGVAERYFPPGFFDRAKMGFGVPIGEWLRTDLKDWSADLLLGHHDDYLEYFEPKEFQTMWDEHQAGVRDRHLELWPVLMYFAWQREWSGGGGATFS